MRPLKKRYYENHHLGSDSALVKRYSKAVLDINDFNLQLRDAMFSMKEIINHTTVDEPDPLFRSKTYTEWNNLALEAIDAISKCANDCYEVLARFKSVRNVNQDRD